MDDQTIRVICLLWSGVYTSVIFVSVDLSIFIPVSLLLCVMFCSISGGSKLTSTDVSIFVLFAFSGTALVFGVRWICIEAYCFKFECCRASWIPSNVLGKLNNVHYDTLFIRGYRRTC